LGDDLAIRCEGLTRFHGTTPGILDLDLSVPRGQVFGFLGPNGAGKTTTIRLLLDLLRPDRGRATVLGEDVRAGGGALRARIGYLPGDLALFPRVTGAEVLDLFARLQRRAPVRRAEVLEALDFPAEALRRRARTWSTGMRQMIGIAIAFQHDPELLILDEPTTGLDPLVRSAFLDLVRGASARGATVFLSSHVLDEVDKVADRVGLIARAKLRLVEDVDELRRRWPRRVRVRLRDGTEREWGTAEAATPLLDELRALDPADVEIARAALDDVFRAIVEEAGS
jgi:ABC-2 type transport system ATP-binding protein